MSYVLLFLVCAALAVGIGFVLDRTPSWAVRLANRPFAGMPGTNGAIIGVAIVGAMLGLAWVLAR